MGGKDGSKDKLWKESEEALNKSLWSLFLAEGGRAPRLYIALDDDKICFQFSSRRDDKDYLCGLKPSQHVKSNRRGFTLDTAVSAVTGFPLMVSALRQAETKNDNYDSHDEVHICS